LGGVPRLAAPLVAAALLAALVAGCGDSSVEIDGSRTGTVTSVVPIPDKGKSMSRAPFGASARSCDAYSTDAGALRATGISCSQARQVMYGWQRERSCATPAGASRSSCLTRSYRCQATRTDRGLAVSCARKGQSIAFISRRG
jgi:hypothetical protein